MKKISLTVTAIVFAVHIGHAQPGPAMPRLKPASASFHLMFQTSYPPYYFTKSTSEILFNQIKNPTAEQARDLLWANDNTYTSTDREIEALSMSFYPYNKRSGKYLPSREWQFTLASVYVYGYICGYYWKKDFYKDTIALRPKYTAIYDSFERQYSDFDARYKELNLNASYIFRTSPERRISLFTAPGFEFGFTRSAVMHQYTYDLEGGWRNLFTSYKSNGDTIAYFQPDYQEVEKGLKLANSIMLRPNISFGINYRLSKKVNYLNKTYLYLLNTTAWNFRFCQGKFNAYAPISGFGIGLSYRF